MASGFSQGIVLGNLTRDPELRYLPSGDAIVDFSIAVNRKSGKEKKEEVSYFDVTAFAKTAELCAEYLKKGSKALVVGRLRQDSWEKDGVKKSKIVIVADTVQFLSGKDAE